MSDNYHLLSEKDVQELQALLSEVRNRGQNTRNRAGGQLIDHQEILAPEAYIAVTPATGIPAMIGNTPGSALCNIYQLLNGALQLTSNYPKTVYNFSAQSIQDNAFISIFRDKYGTWIALSLGSDTTTTEPFNLVTDVCPIKDPNGDVTGIKVQYTPISLPIGSIIGVPFCLTDSTQCCVTCKCEATGWELHASGFSGAFANFSCVNLPCTICGGQPLPPVVHVSLAVPGKPIDGLQVDFVYDDSPGYNRWESVPQVFPGQKISLPCGTHGWTGVLQCFSTNVLQFSLTELRDSQDPPDFGGFSDFIQTMGGNGTPITCDPFKVVITGTILAGDWIHLDPACDSHGGTFTATITGSAESGSGNGFNDIIFMGAAVNDIWTFSCGSRSITVRLSTSCMLIITYTASTGDTAVYEVNVGSNCCETFIANLVSTTAPGSVPNSVTVTGFGCTGTGSSGPGTGGTGSAGSQCPGLGTIALGGTQGTTVSTLTKTITLAKGELLVVCTGDTTTALPTSVTLGAHSLTLADGLISNPPGNGSQWIYYNNTGADIVSATLTVNLSASAGWAAMVARAITGLKLNDEDNSVVGAGNGTPTATLPATIAKCEFSVANAVAFSSFTLTQANWSNGYTEGQAEVSADGHHVLSEGWQVFPNASTIGVPTGGVGGSVNNYIMVGVNYE